MAIAVTRRAGEQRTSAASHAITLPAEASVGSLLVLAITMKTGSSQSVSTVVGLDTTFAKINHGFNTGSNSRVELWSGVIVTAGTDITITPTTSLALSWDAFEVTGFDTVTPVQSQSADASGTAAGTTVSLGSPNPTTEGTLIICAAGIATTSAIVFSDLTAGFTEGAALGGSAALAPIYTAYQLGKATGATATQVTQDVSAASGYANVVIAAGAEVASSARPLRLGVGLRSSLDRRLIVEAGL